MATSNVRLTRRAAAIARGNIVETNVNPTPRRQPRQRARTAARTSLWNCGLYNPTTGEIELVTAFRTLNVPSANEKTRYPITIQAIEDGMYEIDLSNRVGDLQKVYTRVPYDTTLLGVRVLGVNNNEHQLNYLGNRYIIYSRSRWGISVDHLTVLQRDVYNSKNIPEEHKISIVAGIYRYKFALDGSHRSLARQIGTTTSNGLQFVALRPSVVGTTATAPQMINTNFLNRTNIPYNTFISTFAVHLTVDRMSAGIHLLSGLRQSALLYVGQTNMVYISALQGRTIDDNYFKQLFITFINQNTNYLSNPIINLIYQNMFTNNIDTILQFMDGIHDFVDSRGSRMGTTTRREAFAKWYVGNPVMQQVVREFTNARLTEICFREFINHIGRSQPADIEATIAPRSNEGLDNIARTRVLPRAGSFVIDVSPISFYTTNLHLAILRTHDGEINRSQG